MSAVHDNRMASTTRVTMRPTLDVMTEPRGQLHVDQATYDRIGEVASIMGTSRVQVVRDALERLEEHHEISKDVTRRLADREQLQERLRNA